MLLTANCIACFNSGLTRLVAVFISSWVNLICLICTLSNLLLNSFRASSPFCFTCVKISLTAWLIVSEAAIAGRVSNSACFSLEHCCQYDSFI